jgi:2-dehydropantoate 2-reductase
MIRMRGAAEREIIIMKYAIIGAGGTGGILGFYMTKAGKDVTLIARGRHLAAMQESGLAVEKMWDGTTETIPVKAADMDHYSERPDVILVCVKGYSLEDTIPFIQSVANPSTIVIPVLNIYGTGAKMQEKLPNLLVTDGCIYVSANIKEPGVLIQHGKILRVVYGVREKEEYDPRLEEIKQDFDASGIDGVLSENIRRDALEKFSYVSPIGAAGLYYHATAADFQREGEEREAFKTMIREITALAEAMGVPFERDMVEVNLKILSTLASEATTSMQRDVMDGKSSEIDGLVYEVVCMGERYHVPVPMYEKVAEKLKETL